MFVGMLDSPHFHTWLKHFQHEFANHRIFLFPSDRPRLTRSKICKLKGTHKNTNFFRILPHGEANRYLFALLDLLFGLNWRAYFLGKKVSKLRPSIIHFHEMQHGAYIFNLLVGYRTIPKNMKKVISTWGSDLTLFAWSEVHQTQLETCLRWTSLLTAEKRNEESEARRLGYSGEFRAPVYIHVGSSPKEDFSQTPPSQRSRIVVKGFQDLPGRALNALEVIARNLDLFSKYEILVFSASEPVKLKIDMMRNRDHINIRTFNAPHAEMQQIFLTARLAVGLAESDGLPASFVEALAAGCFTIQSKNSAAIEFIKDGVNGFLVDPWDLKQIESAFHRALSDDSLVDLSVEISRKMLDEKYNLEIGISNLRSIYL
jgi:glycosyltransferase involved in cell wall biosynthesis